MKFTMQELLRKSGVKFEDLDTGRQANALEFMERLNDLGQYYPKSATVSSFYRTPEKQIEIYKEKALLKQSPFSDGVFNERKVPMNSAHIWCLAVDLIDPAGEIDKWLMGDGRMHLERLCLYVEHAQYTPGWSHIQYRRPGSGDRFFKP